VKKLGIALVIVLTLAVVALAKFRSYSPFGAGLGALLGGGDVALLEELARHFLEDLQYKDFDKAGTYHTFLDQAKVEIPKLIERLFQVKPEVLNIRDFKITDVTIDESGQRARTFFNANMEILNTARDGNPNEEKKIEGILYWHRRPAIEAKAVKPADTAVRPTGSTEPAPAAGSEAPPAASGMTAAAPAPGTESPPMQWFMELESSLH
jgi:hypothetical protein